MLAEMLIALPVLALLTGYVLEAARRRHAEARYDALRADAVRLLVDVEQRLDAVDAEIRAWHRAVPQAWSLDPETEHLREAGRVVHVARFIASQGRTLLGG